MATAPAVTVLLTGFEAFDKEPVNSSWLVARALNSTTVSFGKTSVGKRADGKPSAGRGRTRQQALIIARQLPCEFDRSRLALARLVKRLDPDLVIVLGQANSRPDFSVERVAININDARIKDNVGAKPVDTSVIAGAPAAYFSRLPIKAIVQAVRAAGIPSSVSQTAGTFVCNHVFFGLMHLLATDYTRKRGGFIHVPPLPEQAARLPGTASLGLDTLVQATRIAIATSLSVLRDRRISDGAVD